jgi:predicted ester cyclase/mannose-6-phosphate isomerase-like protein (cupin superfamily)
MPRRIIAPALVLSLLTGLVLGQLRHLGIDQAAAVPSRNSSSLATAHVFYAAVNQYLGTGDPAPVADLLAPDFVSHNGSLADDQTAEEFLRYLASIRSGFPGLRFETADLVAQDNAVAVEVSLTGSRKGTFAGLDVEAGSGGAGYELLGINEGQVVELWGSRDLPLFETMLEADGPAVSNSYLEPQFERRFFDKGTEFSYENAQGAVLIPESAGLSLEIENGPVTVSSASDEAAWPASDERIAHANEAVHLEPDATVQIPAGHPFRVWNSGADVASMLVLSIRQIDPQYYQYTAMSGGGQQSETSFEVLASGGRLRPFHGPYTIMIGRATLPPGTEIPTHVTGENEMLAVTSGTIEVTVADGTTWLSNEDVGLRTVEGTVELTAGDGVSSHDGAEIGYRATGSEAAEVWVINITE